MGKPEAKVETYLVHEVIKRGGEIRKLEWIGRSGAPDRVAMLQGLTIWVECKATGEELQPHQAREIKKMRERGQWVAVVDSIESVDLLMQRIDTSA